MGWAVTGCARKRCLLLVLWVWLATAGPSAGWRRVDLAWLRPVVFGLPVSFGKKQPP